MPKIIKILASKGIDYLTPQFETGEEFSSKEAVAETLKGLLKSSLQDCCFLAALSEDDNDVLGFVVAFVHPNGSHVVLFQLKAENEILRSQLLLRLLLWCEQIEIPELRFDSVRVNAEDLENWGAIPRNVIYSLKISDKIETMLLATVNGKKEEPALATKET